MFFGLVNHSNLFFLDMFHHCEPNIYLVSHIPGIPILSHRIRSMTTPWDPWVVSGRRLTACGDWVVGPRRFCPTATWHRNHRSLTAVENRNYISIYIIYRVILELMSRDPYLNGNMLKIEMVMGQKSPSQMVHIACHSWYWMVSPPVHS